MNSNLQLAVIFLFSQKGGTGKSTLARAVAVESSKEVKTLLADLDYGQQTSYKGALRRREFAIKPLVDCQTFSTYQEAKDYALAHHYRIMIVDGPAFVSKMTVEIAQEALIVIHPIRPSLDDIESALAELNTLSRTINSNKLLLVINQVSSVNSAVEKFTRQYFAATPYAVLPEVTFYKASYANAQAEGKSINEINHKDLKEKTAIFMKALIDKITA